MFFFFSSPLSFSRPLNPNSPPHPPRSFFSHSLLFFLSRLNMNKTYECKILTSGKYSIKKKKTLIHIKNEKIVISKKKKDKDITYYKIKNSLLTENIIPYFSSMCFSIYQSFFSAFFLCMF